MMTLRQFVARPETLSAGQLECLGRGRNAEWRKTRKWELGSI